MHEFKYKNNRLYCEGVSVETLAKKFGTPLYVYSYATLIGHYNKLKSAFKPIEPLICYSVKANSNLSILKALVSAGSGLDIVSGGELFRAIKAGCPAKRIVYASVGKTDGEIRVSIKRGILSFNVESIAELENINRIAGIFNKVVNISIRINPDVEPKTHKFITTGKLTNKFGIDFDNAHEIIIQRHKFANLNISGLHIHIGSQITEADPYVAAILKVTSFIQKLKERGVGLEYLNIGGGLGIVYDKENPQTAEKFAQKILPLLKKTGLKIIMEPGRFIVGNAGILLTKVLYLKSTPVKKFVVVDAGMNDLVRPALYDAYHQILPTSYIPCPESCEKVDVVGPICESADYFAKGRKLPSVLAGDYLAVMSAGAYGFSMASNYNSRRRAAEVIVKGNKVFLIRKRESFMDLIRDEIVVEL
ncbi:MAG: diaminopimelate decarboxylase [Candidatus Omnitrophica bacterium]|jgi:diaminopimelate decarboxylase|nr:diaminopimelate decarboxylase [Candidatus Omnitrophota bacterium]